MPTPPCFLSTSLLLVLSDLDPLLAALLLSLSELAPFLPEEAWELADCWLPFALTEALNLATLSAACIQNVEAHDTQTPRLSAFGDMQTSMHRNEHLLSKHCDCWLLHRTLSSDVHMADICAVAIEVLHFRGFDTGCGVDACTCCVLMKKSARRTPSALHASHCCWPVFSTKAMPPVSKGPCRGTWMVTACTAMSGLSR